MSIQYCEAAWSAKLTSSRKFVLLALANMATPDGFCWPTVNAIAGACALARTTVIDSLDDLERMQVLTRQALGHQRRNGYRLDLQRVRALGGAVPAEAVAG